MCSLLSGESDFVAVDTEKTNVPNVFFVFVFTNKFFHLLILLPVQERQEATEQTQQNLDCPVWGGIRSYSALRRDGFRGGPTAASQDPARDYQESRDTHFPVGLYGRMRDSECKL